MFKKWLQSVESKIVDAFGMMIIFILAIAFLMLFLRLIEPIWPLLTFAFVAFFILYGWVRNRWMMGSGIILYLLSWFSYENWGWDEVLSVAFCTMGFLLFFFAPFVDRPVFAKLRWPESRVLLRPPF